MRLQIIFNYKIKNITKSAVVIKNFNLQSYKKLKNLHTQQKN